MYLLRQKTTNKLTICKEIGVAESVTGISRYKINKWTKEKPLENEEYLIEWAEKCLLKSKRGGYRGTF
jgi:hypothetical protein